MMKIFYCHITALVASSSIAFGAISLNESGLAGSGAESPETLAQKALADAKVAEGPVAEANKSFAEGRFEEAVKLAKPLAEKGDADALFLLGLARETGKGLEVSRDEALKLYRKASAAGHTDAGYRTSLILLASDEEKERAEARKVLEAAAKDDPAVAGRILGEAWLTGRLSEKPNPQKAAQWWERAAASDDLSSILMLASLHEGKFGFPETKNLKRAYELYNEAIKLGHVSSLVTLGSRLLMGEESLRDEKRGRALLERAVEKEDFSACLVLGDFEENVKKNDKAALAAYERGEDGGQVDCMLRAADFYLQGRGVKKDESRGKALVVKAAQAGHPEAQFRVAMSLLSAEKPDLGAAYLNLLAAANSGLPAAQNELGLFYLSGTMGVADQAAAVAWLTRAAKLGNAPAQNNLATLYEAGAAGLDQDYKNAVELYSLAARRGHPEATLALIRLYSEGPIELNLPRAWALAAIAEERGVESVKEIKEGIAVKLDKAQLKQAKELLGQLKGSPKSSPKGE